MQNVRLIELTPINPQTLHNPLCIIGMPGIADIGKFAVDQLIGIFKAEKYCDIIFNDYPAGAIVDNSLLSTPKAEILIYRDPKEVQDLILVTADAQAMSPRGIYEISDFIAELIYNLGVNQILALGAYPINKTHSENVNIYLTSTENEKLQNFFENSLLKKVKKGVIIGSNGLIPTLAKARFNISGVVMLAETDKAAIMDDSFTDLQASVKLLEIAAKEYHLPIKNQFSDKKINEISANLADKRKELENDLDQIQPKINVKDNDRSLYI